MTLRDALDRTLLLMRDYLDEQVSDVVLLDALTSTRVLISADEANLQSHSAQSAFFTLATLCARSGATVFLDAPNVHLIQPHRPATADRLIDALMELNGLLVPKESFRIGSGKVDLAATLGDTPPKTGAAIALSLNADDWGGSISEFARARPWVATDWPMGGLAAAALVAGEVFKAAMRKLRPWRRNDVFDEFYAATTSAAMRLSPPDSPKASDLGAFDFISGGAITQAVLFALSRIPDVRGVARVIEPEPYDLSNSNRYMLMRLDRPELMKPFDLETMDLGGLHVVGVPLRFDASTAEQVGPLAAAVLVGVDHIPTRWFVGDLAPGWIGIGATSHHSVMVTTHDRTSSCARCAHPKDDPGAGPIPTVAFVSFWSGLVLAARFVQQRAGSRAGWDERQTWFEPLRPESGPQLTLVHGRNGCPRCGRSETVSAAAGDSGAEFEVAGKPLAH